MDLHLAHLRAWLALRAPVAILVDEIAHETFVFAFRNLRDFTPGTSFRAWLRGIAGNLLRAEVQRYSREQANQARFAEQQHSGLDFPAAAKESADVDFLEQCLESLPVPLRELMHLKYHEEHSTDEIARRLRRSLAWVRTVLFRVRRDLKNCIEQKLEERRL
jgi:RNA polymerase sigma-70 factor, ECF subfamily